MPMFSVIIPTFNRARLCRAAVESVLAQETGDFELIVVDDGSTDGTAEAIAPYGDRLRLLRQENQGQSIARNAAIAVARGEYIAFLDSDDQWFPWTLTILSQVIRSSNAPAMVAGRSLLFEPEHKLAIDARAQPLDVQVFENLLDFIAQSKPIIFETGVLVLRADALKAVGGFTPTRHNSEDVDLCLRLATARGFARMNSPPLFAKLAHANNVGLEVGRSASGLKAIFKREQAGAYPGGTGGQRARRKLISAAFRNAVYLAARQGQIGLAWSLYRRCALWNLQLGRYRFVAGVPAWAAVGVIRRWRSRARWGFWDSA